MTMLAIGWAVGKAINGAAEGLARAVTGQAFQVFLEKSRQRWGFLTDQVNTLKEMLCALSDMVVSAEAACAEPANRERVAKAVVCAEAAANLWGYKRAFAGLEFQPLITPIVARGTEIAAALTWYLQFGCPLMNRKPEDMSEAEWEAERASIAALMGRCRTLAMETQGGEMAELSRQVADYLCRFLPNSGPLAQVYTVVSEIRLALSPAKLPGLDKRLEG